MTALSSTQVNTLERILTLGIEFVRSLETEGAASSGAPAAPSPAPEAQWVWEYRRAWKFLKAVEDAGGNVSPTELSRLARENGYDPRGLGGYYTGDNASLRHDGDRRLLTAAGRRYIERWKDEFGD